MKRTFSISLVIFLIAILSACNQATAYTTISAPLEFASLQDFINARNDKKAAASQPPDPSFDLQKLIAADKLFRIASFSNLTKEAKITINSDYVMIHYDYDNPDKELVAIMSDDPDMQKDTLLSVILTWRRGQGEADFNAQLDWNGKNGTIMAIGNNNKVLMLVGHYKEKLVLKSFEFLFNGNYLTLQVPGNVDEVYVGSIFDHIQEVPLE
jgi:hypothetical protein